MKRIFSFATALLISALLANVSGFRLPRSVFPDYSISINPFGASDPWWRRNRWSPGPLVAYNSCLEYFGKQGRSFQSCSDELCKNGGVKCQYSTRCACRKGTDGECCSEIVDCRKEDFCGSDKTATCQYNTFAEKGVCLCSRSDEKFDEREKKCRRTCENDGDCVNGGKCTGHGQYYGFCECLPGTEGSFCSEVTDCKKNEFCGTSNETTCTYDSTQMQAVCNCSDTSKKFDYKEKTCRVPCEDDSTCENGHKCVGNEDPKFCECIPGKEVNLCSHVTDCDEPDSCGIGNEVTCEYDTVELKGRCQCSNSSKQFDYRENICREPCQDGDCENGGKCTGHGEFKFCQCLPGTTGDRCSEVTDCEVADFCGTGNDTTCVYNSTRIEAVCQCLNSSKQFDYKEKFCRETCQESDCENGANCTLSEDFAFCECLPGTAGDFCSEVKECKKDNFCGTHNDSTCMYDSLLMEATCQCLNSNMQFDYKENICKKPCQENGCENGGNCTGDGYFKFCECLPGTADDFCSEVTECKEDNFCGTDNDSICAYDILRTKAICQCSNSSKKFDRKENFCKEPCQESDCQNGGNCTGDGDFKFCECLPGTSGDHCSEITECKKDTFCGTDSDAKCTYDSLRMEAICQCSNPNKQFDYKEKICKEPCQDVGCDNGGNCTGDGDYKFCECLPGTTGDLCSEVTKCKEENFCGKDSTCVYDTVRKEAACECLNWKKHFDPKQKMCRLPCGAEKCENGGICNGTRDLQFCECLLGTSGDFCTEISVCRDNVLCGYGSDVQCVYDKISQRAACECLNSNADFNYLTNKCECDCGHNGTCALDVFGGKDCSCNEGFAEFNGWCEECSCRSGENCSFDSYGRKMCTCSTGFIDLNGICERMLLGESKESTFPALIGSLFAFLVIAFSGLFYLRWRKQKPGTAFQFKKLMESMDEEYEKSVYLK